MSGRRTGTFSLPPFGADTVSVGVPSSAKNASTLASGIFLCRDVRPLSSEWVTWTYRVGSGGA